MKSTIYEFNKASEGYWRKWERDTGWLAREMIWWMISASPYIKNEDKPKSRELIMKLSIDGKKEVVKKKVPKVTEDDLVIYQALNFNPKP